MSYAKLCIDQKFAVSHSDIARMTSILDLIPKMNQTHKNWPSGSTLQDMTIHIPFFTIVLAQCWVLLWADSAYDLWPTKATTGKLL